LKPIRALSGGIALPELGWPTPPDPGDGWGGAEVLDDPAPFHNFSRFGGEAAEGVDEATFEALDAAFLARLRAVLRGEAAWDDPELLRLVEALRLDHDIQHDSRPLVEGSALHWRALTDMTEDHIPDVAPMAADRILGPWADEAPSRALITTAVTALAFAPLMPSGNSTAGFRYAHRPRPSHAERDGLRAALRAPPMLWAVPEDPSLPWTPLLPLAPQMRPDGPTVGAATPLPHVDVVRAVVGRLHPDGQGRWHLTAGVGLGAHPPEAPLTRRLTLTLWRARRHERRANWEDLLRRRSEVLYRTCAHWWWRTLS